MRKFLQMLSAFHHNKILDFLNVKQVVRNFLGKFPENPKIVKFAKCKPLTRKFRGENHIKQKFWVNVSFLIGCWFDFIPNRNFWPNGSSLKFTEIQTTVFHESIAPPVSPTFSLQAPNFLPNKKREALCLWPLPRSRFQFIQNKHFNLIPCLIF